MTEPVPSPDLDLDLVTAALRADSADATIYAQVLTESLGESLPPGCVTIERDRTVSDRMHGRPGKVTKITVRLGEQVMTLAVRAGQPSAEILQQIAKGLRISAEALYVQAGILEDRPGDSGVRAALLTDPQLTERQKQVLIEIYESFRRESQKPPTAEVVAVLRDRPAPAVSTSETARASRRWPSPKPSASPAAICAC